MLWTKVFGVAHCVGPNPCSRELLGELGHSLVGTPVPGGPMMEKMVSVFPADRKTSLWFTCCPIAHSKLATVQNLTAGESVASGRSVVNPCSTMNFPNRLSPSCTTAFVTLLTHSTTSCCAVVCSCWVMISNPLTFSVVGRMRVTGIFQVLMIQRRKETWEQLNGWNNPFVPLVCYTQHSHAERERGLGGGYVVWG